MMVLNQLNIHYFKEPTYRIAFIIVASLQVMLASAPIFGYSSLLIIFKELRLYQELCDTVAAMNTTANATIIDDVTRTCTEQDRALNLPFAFGIIIHYTVKIPFGTLVDNLGAKPSQYIGCTFLMLFGMSLTYIDRGSEYLLFLAFIFLAISSTLLMLCPYQVANILFTKNKALVISLLSGCIDGSTAVFIVFLELFQLNVSFSTICITYSVGSSCLLMITTTILYPSKNVLQTIVNEETQKIIRPDFADYPAQESMRVMRSEDFSARYMSSYNMYHESIHKSLELLNEAVRREAILASLSQNLAIQMSMDQSHDYEGKKLGKPYGTIKENVQGFENDSYGGSRTYFGASTEKISLITPASSSSKNKLLTPYSGGNTREYFLSMLNIVCIYTMVVTMLKIIYFIGNLDKYLLQVTDFNTATTYIKYFGYVQFTGIIAAPICSLFFMLGGRAQLSAEDDFFRKVKQLILPAFVYITILLVLNILQLFEKLELSIPIFLLYLFGNSMMWCYGSLFYAYLFPAQYYCTMFGIAMGICGVFSFVQYPLLYIEQNVFNGNQFWTNIIFTALLVTTYILPLYLAYFYKTKKPVPKESKMREEGKEKMMKDESSLRTKFDEVHNG